MLTRPETVTQNQRRYSLSALFELIPPHTLSGPKPRRYETLASGMAKWKQYELWVQTAENKWEIVGLFPSTELATVVANSRASRARLIEVLYDGSKMLGQEIIAEIGNTRKE